MLLYGLAAPPEAKDIALQRQWLSNISKHGSSSSQPSRAISVESNPSISVAKMPSPTASVGDSKVIVVAHQNHRLQNQRLGKGTGRVEHIGKLFEEYVFYLHNAISN